MKYEFLESDYGDRILHPLSELISSVVITNDCSSETMKQIDGYHLKPTLYKLPGEGWKKVA